MFAHARAQTKPHGHGDVHALLHASGLAKKWQKEGFKWVCFFQVSVLLVRSPPLSRGRCGARPTDAAQAMLAMHD